MYNMAVLFIPYPDFNQDISSWDVSNVIDMREMFNNCFTFNGVGKLPIDEGNPMKLCPMAYYFGLECK